MAITQYLTVRGILLPEAYIRIDRLTGGKYAGFQAEAGLYASRDVSFPLDTVGFAFDFVVGEDLLVTAYAALKRLPEFTEAKDC